MGLEGLPSFVAMVVAALFAVVAASLSRGPDAGHLRWFSRAAAAAAVFGASNATMGLQLSDALRVAASQLSFCAAALFGVGWMFYVAGEEGRRLSRGERIFVTVAVIAGLSSLVPGLAIRPEIDPREAMFGLVYRDAVPTTLGGLYTLQLLALLVWSTFRAALWLRAGRSGGWSLLVASLLALVAGVSDTLAFLHVTRAPYLLDAAFLTFVLVAGLRVADRFVATARALEETSRKLSAAQAELVQRERLAALGELSATVAHEVRTPVAVIFNVLPSLRRELAREPGEAAKLLGMLEEEAERLRRLVDDLLDFVRPLTPRRVTAKLASIAKEASQAAVVSREGGSSVEVLVEGDGCELACDPQLLHRALANLVGNAIEAGAKRVTLRARTEATAVQLEVIDEGPGVPPARQAELFRPFSTTRASGTGLGLSVVRRIVEAHGGTIAYTPTPGGGATFLLNFPR